MDNVIVADVTGIQSHFPLSLKCRSPTPLSLHFIPCSDHPSLPATGPSTRIRLSHPNSRVDHIFDVQTTKSTLRIPITTLPTVDAFSPTRSNLPKRLSARRTKDAAVVSFWKQEFVECCETEKSVDQGIYGSGIESFPHSVPCAYAWEALAEWKNLSFGE